MMKFVGLKNTCHRCSKMKKDKYSLVVFQEDKPDELDPDTIYIVGDNWIAMFLCPCGCGEIIHLCLLGEKAGSPRWTYTRHADGAATFSPSILRTAGCCSHFFIRENKVIWT